MNLRRPAGWALIVGTIVAAFGYLAANLLAPDSGDEVFRYHLWPLFEGIAVGGDVIIALGLPVILTFAGRAPKLHIVGYAGIFAALVMLNIGEGVIEGFVKPYLVTHGGIPKVEPAGFVAWESIALVCVLVGLVCLGVAVLRAGRLPRWVGGLLIASAFLSFAVSGLPGPLAELGDDCLMVALIATGLRVRGPSPTRRPRVRGAAASRG